MNEFIVWDKIEKEFIYKYESITFKENWVFIEVEYKPNHFQELSWHSDDVELLNYIGKTDIDGNKIYADCSIVEYLMTYTDDSEPETKKGVFIYNKNTLSYDIENKIAEQLAINSFWVSRASNFKVIGTLQENSDLL